MVEAGGEEVVKDLGWPLSNSLGPVQNHLWEDGVMLV